MVAPSKVSVIEMDIPLEQGCTVCRRIFPEHSHKKFAVGVIVNEQDGEYRYFIGNDEVICCGEKKELVWTSDSEEDAEALQARVIEHMKTRGSTESLNLRAFASKDEVNLPKNMIN